MSENFHIHFTPDYSRAGIPKAYKYNNKPNSLYHWMVNVLHMNETNQSKRMEDAIIMLMDPDMVLLRPLLHDFSGQNMIYTQRKPRTKVVRHGYPMAQQDGYLNSEWLNFNRSYITQSAHLTRITRKDGDLY